MAFGVRGTGWFSRVKSRFWGYRRNFSKSYKRLIRPDIVAIENFLEIVRTTLKTAEGHLTQSALRSGNVARDNPVPSNITPIFCQSNQESFVKLWPPKFRKAARIMVETERAGH